MKLLWDNIHPKKPQHRVLGQDSRQASECCFFRMSRPKAPASKLEALAAALAGGLSITPNNLRDREASIVAKAFHYLLYFAEQLLKMEFWEEEGRFLLNTLD